MAALNHDVIRPLRKTELQPISELAVSGGTVPSSSDPSAIQVRTEMLTGSIDSRDRLYSVNKYSAEQINESATLRAVARIQGGEKAKGESGNAQFVRNHRRGNNPTKYLWKTLILVLWLLGSALGGESRLEMGQPSCQ